MTRAEVLGAYVVNEHGVIMSPGKFEGCMLYVPAFWDLCMDGFTDFEDGGVHGMAFDDSDRDMWPEIGATYGMFLEEDNLGFVHAQEFETKEDYDAACVLLAAQEDFEQEKE